MSVIQHVYQGEGQRRCVHNRNIFTRLKKDYKDLKVEEIPSDSSEGQELREKFDISVLPATVVDGQFYRSGGVDEEELRQMLDNSRDNIG